MLAHEQLYPSFQVQCPRQIEKLLEFSTATPGVGSGRTRRGGQHTFYASGQPRGTSTCWSICMDCSARRAADQSAPREPGGNTALLLAAGWGRLPIVAWLVETARSDMDHVNNLGDMALHRAANWGREEVIKYLLTYRARSNIRNKRGCSSLRC